MQELEQALQAERIAAQRDRAMITKLQRQINKVSQINVTSVSINRVIVIEYNRYTHSTYETWCVTNIIDVEYIINELSTWISQLNSI